MKEYLITTTNQCGDATFPIIFHAYDINDAIEKFQNYVINEINETFANIKIDTNKNTSDMISELEDKDCCHIESTLIHIDIENNNGDEWTEWNLYEMSSLPILEAKNMTSTIKTCFSDTQNKQ